MGQCHGRIENRLHLTRVQGPRAQIDRKLYKKHMQAALSNYPNLDIQAGSVFDLVFDHEGKAENIWGKISGVKLGKILQYDIHHESEGLQTLVPSLTVPRW